MIKDQIVRRLFFLRLLAGAIVSAPLIAASKVAEAANIAFENVLFLSGAAGATTKRTPAQRCADIFNVMDYGAKGDGATDDTVAIQAAINAMYASAKQSGIVFFPPGQYKVSDSGSGNAINLGGGVDSGIIRGSGDSATTIVGTLNNGFIFSLADGVNGPEEISNLGLANSSTNIGSGALMVNNTRMRMTSLRWQGQINALMPSNVIDAKIENCTGSANIDGTTGTTGTFGIAGDGCNIQGWRTTGGFQAAIQLTGANPCVVSNSSNENCTVGLVAGMQTGWASSCTVSGNVLTVSGNLGSLITRQFFAGSEIFMKGLTTTADWGISPLDASICTITETHDQNPSRTGQGFAGTYTISRSATISTPVPCVGRVSATLAGAAIIGYTTEASYYSIFVMNVGASSFISSGGSSAFNECVDAFGNTGFTPNSCFYIHSAIATSFMACSAESEIYNAGWYFDPSQSVYASFISCTSSKQSDNITGTSSSISGTVLTVVSLSQSSFVGVGMKVTGSGVTAGTVITGNHASDASLTGTGGTGTYRVNNSQTVSATALTIHTGEDWVLPTADSGKTAVEFFNTYSLNLPVGYTTGLNSLNRTYASLPGNSGAYNQIPVAFGMSFPIVDGQKSGGGVAAPGDVILGGGTQKIGAFYNGTNWTRNA